MRWTAWVIGAWLATMAAAAAQSGQAGADPVVLVRDGEARCAIVVQTDGEPQLLEAAKLLADYIHQSTGAEPPVSEQPPGDDSLVQIHIGATSYVRGLQPALPWRDLDEEGFLIAFPQPDRIVLIGGAATGTRFAVCEFLERYVGVRWLMPGPFGTHVPQRRTIEVPTENVREEPAFLSRQLSGLNSPDEKDWSQFARLRGRIKFHHQLIRLFPPSVYAQTHPEFFPLIDGKRRLPSSDSDYKWQPCFTNPAVAQEAIHKICEYFDQHPGAVSYSLGVNDTRTESWCQCESCRALYSGRTNRPGLPDYSDVYYAWCNQVIEGVLREHPDVWFGCLAYNNVFDPPTSVQLHPRLIPYICTDRMQWADPQRRRQGHEDHQRWLEAASTLGWYDYIYGKQYFLPRVYFHRMAEDLRYGREHGVRAFYAEAYPNPGEGPKLYVAAKLLWNPDADVDELLHDWYTCFAGEAAAQDLARYYEHWEDFWTRRVLESRWFGSGDGSARPLRQYLDFSSQTYLELVTEQEMSQCRRWLGSALAKAVTDEQKARVRVLLDAFEGYEIAVFHYRASVSDPPSLRALTPFLRSDAPESWRVRARLLREILQGRVSAVSRNVSFEEGGEGGPTAWNLWVKATGEPPYGELRWVDRPAAAGGRGQCLLAQGVRRGGPAQQIHLPPGQYLMTASYMLPAGQPEQTAELSVVLKDEKGQAFRSQQAWTVSVPLIPGGWRTASRSFAVPQQIDGRAVASVQFAFVFEQPKANMQAYCDDVGIYRLGD